MQRKTLVITFLVLVLNCTAKAQTQSKAAERWLKSGVWAGNLKINIYPGINADEFKRQFEANKKTWDKALALLADTAKLRTMAVGRYELDGDNAYAKITSQPSKVPETVQWESHKKYIDLQYIISGGEQIEVAGLSALTLTQPYDAAADVAHYSGTGKMYVANPSVFFIFFPTDPHRASMQLKSYTGNVKKLVIKIAYVK